MKNSLIRTPILFATLLVLTFALSGCTDDDESLLFLEKYDTTLWKDVMNSCGAMPPLNHSPYNYSQHFFMRFEKNNSGYIRFIEAYYPENFCEQAYWECWQVRSEYGDMANHNYIEIVSQTEDFINYNLFLDEEAWVENWRGYNIQINYNDGLLSVRIEDYNGKVRFKSYEKSHVDFNSLEFCD